MLGVDERAAPCNGRREFKDTALLAADQTSLPRTSVPMLQRATTDETDIHTYSTGIHQPSRTT